MLAFLLVENVVPTKELYFKPSVPLFPRPCYKCEHFLNFDLNVTEPPLLVDMSHPFSAFLDSYTQNLLNSKKKISRIYLKIPQRRALQPTPVFLPKEPHGQRSLVGYGPWGHKESDFVQLSTNLAKCNLACSTHNLSLLEKLFYKK